MTTPEPFESAEPSALFHELLAGWPKTRRAVLQRALAGEHTRRVEAICAKRREGGGR